MGKGPEAIQREIEDTRERMGDRVDAITYKADVPSRIGDRISETRDAVADKLGGMRAGLGDRAPDAGEVRERSRRVASTLRDNPLGLAIGAAAAGFLVGMLLPSTRVEDERLGETADELKGRAAQTGREAFERGRQVTQDAARTAMESGQRHAEELGDSAHQHASDVASTAREQAGS
jgi:ElaB/YqjD/DUF883 family membrane-anchored ribosome-binding protein